MNHAPQSPDPIPDYAHKIQNGYINNSPPTDSPTTPVSNSVAPDIKIDMDFQEQESDVRHEPLPIKPIDAIDKNDDQGFYFFFSFLVFLCLTFIFSDPISIKSSTSLTPDDVKMSDELQINGSVKVHINGLEDDIQMVDTDSQTPGATPGISGDFSMASIDGSTSVTRSYPDDSDEHGEPPAKRARILSSDVDMRYTAHVSPYFFPLCAVMGVLIWHVCSLPLLPQVRNPAASFCRHFHCCKSCSSTHPSRHLHDIGSSLYRCRLSTRVYHECRPASILLVHSP
jgi:hypothetical protein